MPRVTPSPGFPCEAGAAGARPASQLFPHGPPEWYWTPVTGICIAGVPSLAWPPAVRNRACLREVPVHPDNLQVLGIQSPPPPPVLPGCGARGEVRRLPVVPCGPGEAPCSGCRARATCCQRTPRASSFPQSGDPTSGDGPVALGERSRDGPSPVMRLIRGGAGVFSYSSGRGSHGQVAQPWLRPQEQRPTTPVQDGCYRGAGPSRLPR